MRALALFSGLILLTACGDWPDAGGPPMERRSSNWPELLPLSDLVESGVVQTAENEDAQSLAARAAALQSRARILRASAGDADAMEALRARLR